MHKKRLALPGASAMDRTFLNRRAGSNDDYRDLQSLAGEAAVAAWRAWRVPLDNRTRAARTRVPGLDLDQHPVQERTLRAEMAWEEVVRRDPRFPL